MREDTTSRISGDRVFCSNHWDVRGTLLKNILDNWAVFQTLWVGILEGEVGSDIRGQVKGDRTQMLNFDFFF